MMAPWILHWLDAEGMPSAWRAVVEAEVGAARDAIARIAPLHPIDMLVQAVPHWGIPGLGLNGVSYRAGLLALTIDPASPDRERSLAEGLLRRIVVHEVHHCMRMRAGAGARPTLGAAMVNEGLADHFVVEVLGPPPAPWTTPFSEAEWATIRLLAPAARDDRNLQQGRWLYAAGDGPLPKWAGYRLGFALVGTYLAQQPGRSAAAAVGEPSGSILDQSWPMLFRMLE
jgi:hypothetical protein